MRLFCAAAVMVPLLLIRISAAPADTLTIEQVVQRHLDWLNGRQNFRARVAISDGVNVMTAILLVDMRSRQTQLLLHHDNLPENVSIKATRKDTNTAQFAYSLGLSRTDDLPFAERTFPAPIFGDGSSDLFAYGQDLNETMTRMRLISRDLSRVQSTSIWGDYGLRIALRKTLLDELAAAADRFLAGDKAPPVQPPDVLTLWFGDSGQLNAVQVEDTAGSLNLNVSFEYEAMESPLPPTPVSATQDLTPTASVTPPQAGGRPIDTDRLAEPVLNSWLLIGLSLVLGLLSVGIVIRLRRRPPSE